MAVDPEIFVYEYPPLDLGQNDTSSKSGLIPGELALCRNFYAADRGILWLRGSKKRWVSEDEGNDEAGTGLYEVRDPYGNIMQLKFTETGIWVLSDGAWVEVTGTATLSGGANGQWSLVEHYGKIVACNGGKPIVWDYDEETGFTDYEVTNAPSAAGGVLTFAERIGFYDVTYGEGDEAVRLRNYLHISDTAGDQHTFSEDNKYVCGAKYGSMLNGWKEVNRVLYLFAYPFGTFKLEYTPSEDGQGALFTVRPCDMDVGCISGHTVVSHPDNDWIIFLDSFGEPRIWDTNVEYGRRMPRIAGQLRRTMLENVYRLRNAYASAVFVPQLGQYWVTLTEDPDYAETEHNIILALRVPSRMPETVSVDPSELKKPIAPASIYSGWNINFLSLWEDAEGRMRPVGIDYDGVVWDLWSEANDDETSITAEATLPMFNYGVSMRKRLHSASFSFEMGTDGKATVGIDHVVEATGVKDRVEFEIARCGVEIGEFEVGVDAVGTSGTQAGTMKLSGIGMRSSLRIHSTTPNRYGVGLISVCGRIQRPPEIDQS